MEAQTAVLMASLHADFTASFSEVWAAFVAQPKLAVGQHAVMLLLKHL
jgi:hypothetical protein